MVSSNDIVALVVVVAVVMPWLRVQGWFAGRAGAGAAQIMTFSWQMAFVRVANGFVPEVIFSFSPFNDCDVCTPEMKHSTHDIASLDKARGG